MPEGPYELSEVSPIVPSASAESFADSIYLWDRQPRDWYYLCSESQAAEG
jgi:hypothetical protein